MHNSLVPSRGKKIRGKILRVRANPNPKDFLSDFFPAGYKTTCISADL